MSTWYRAHRANTIDMVFSGEGGLYVAGRWNYKGRKVIYCSQSISLCTLEWLSHNGLSVSAFSYNKYSIEIPEKLITRYEEKELPKHWNKSPSIDKTREFAESNLFNKTEHAAIAVPSVVIPEEYNLVINPLHKDFCAIQKSIKKIGSYTQSVSNIGV